MRIFLYLTLTLIFLNHLISAPQTFAQSDTSVDNGTDNQSNSSNSTPVDADSNNTAVEDPVDQQQIDTARAEATAAWTALQDIQQGKTAGNLDIALNRYLQAAERADNFDTQLQSQNSDYTAAQSAQDLMQNGILASGSPFISGGASIADVVRQNLNPQLSTDRAAMVMGQWAQEYAIEKGVGADQIIASPEFQTSWSNYVQSAVTAGTISSAQGPGALAGGIAIAKDVAGGTTEQIAEAAASIVTFGATDKKIAAFETYVISLNSYSNVNSNQKADSILKFGREKGYTTTQIGLALSGVNLPESERKTIVNQIASSLKQSGISGAVSQLTNEINNGVAIGPSIMAVNIGVEPGGPIVGRLDPNASPTPAATSSPVADESKIGDIVLRAPASQYIGQTGATSEGTKIEGGGTLAPESGGSNLVWSVLYNQNLSGTPSGQLALSFTENSKPALRYEYALGGLTLANVSSGLTVVNSATNIQQFITTHKLTGVKK